MLDQKVVVVPSASSFRHCCVVFRIRRRCDCRIRCRCGCRIRRRCGCRIQECSVCQQLSVISYRLRLLAVDAFAGSQSQPASASSLQLSACSISEKSSACVGRIVCVCLLTQRPVVSSQRPVISSQRPVISSQRPAVVASRQSSQPAARVCVCVCVGVCVAAARRQRPAASS